MKTEQDSRGDAGSQIVSWGQIRGFIQPCLLLLLHGGPSHGYELMDCLSRTPAHPDADPALVYRTLRRLERDGLVNSTWDTGGRGPARRLYRITASGLDHLHEWAARIRDVRRRLEGFLKEYEVAFRTGGELPNLE